MYDKPNEPTKEGLLSFVLNESLFTSVSTVIRGHPSLISMRKAYREGKIERGKDREREDGEGKYEKRKMDMGRAEMGRI